MTDTPTFALTDLSGDYALDVAHSRLGFVARHAMVTKVRGAFGEWEGAAHIDAADPTASWVRLAIKTASIDTGVADRDGHLKSPEFFDVENFPELSFDSSAVHREGTLWTITGNLTIKDVTKPITIDFQESGSAKDPYGNLRAGFEGEATINRRDWGLTWNAALETGGLLVSEKIKLEFDISAIRTS